MRKIISTAAVGAMAAAGLALMVSGASQATQPANDKEECQHYSWTGGPLEEGQIPPRAPGEGWQANTEQEPHGDGRATWIAGNPGLHYTGEPGKANWFDCVVDTPEPRPTVTVTVPGPTVTATETVEVPGPTVTATVPGPTVTVTAPPVPGPTVTVTAVPGATATVPVPGPTVTVTAEPEPAPTVTETVTVTETEPAPVPTAIDGGR